MLEKWNELYPLWLLHELVIISTFASSKPQRHLLFVATEDWSYLWISLRITIGRSYQFLTQTWRCIICLKIIELKSQYDPLVLMVMGGSTSSRSLSLFYPTLAHTYQLNIKSIISLLSHKIKAYSNTETVVHLLWSS